MNSPDNDSVFHVAAFQGTVRQGDTEYGLQRTAEALGWADQRGVDVLAMPETYLQGYFETAAEAMANSLDLESSAFADVCSQLAGFKATCLLGLNERRGDDLYNTVVVIEQGRLVGKYSKNYLVHKYFKRGLEFPVFERAGVKFSIVICKDIGFSEPSRISAMRGAQVIFAPHFNRINIDAADLHLRRVRSDHIARACDNACWVVRSNVIWPYDGKCVGYGDSCIINEIGEVVCQAELSTEAIIDYRIPLERLNPPKRWWSETPPEISDQLADEYRKLPPAPY